MKFTIRQARTHAGLTQAELAKSIGIDRGTYIRMEKDVSRATVGQINLISKITGIPVSNIFLLENSTSVECGGEEKTKKADPPEKDSA